MSTVREIRFFPHLRLLLSTLAYFEKDGLGHTIKNRGLIMLKAPVSTAFSLVGHPGYCTSALCNRTQEKKDNHEK